MTEYTAEEGRFKSLFCCVLTQFDPDYPIGLGASTPCGVRTRGVNVRHPLEPLAKFGVSRVLKISSSKTLGVLKSVSLVIPETPNFASGSLVCRSLQLARSVNCEPVATPVVSALYQFYDPRQTE
jgi:hypothetical protein